MTSNLSSPRRRATFALLGAAVIFTTVALFALIASPADQGALRSWKEYLLTATLFPGVAAAFWALAELYGLGQTRDGRLGRIGIRVATLGLGGLFADGIVTIATGTTETIGPLYPLAMLSSLVGIVLIAIQWHQTPVLPRWIGPTLAIGWFLGATPILGTGGSFLIVAAAFLAIATGLRRPTAIGPSSAVGAGRVSYRLTLDPGQTQTMPE